jgi:hypothetical protein
MSGRRAPRLARGDLAATLVDVKVALAALVLVVVGLGVVGVAVDLAWH